MGATVNGKTKATNKLSPALAACTCKWIELEQATVLLKQFYENSKVKQKMTKFISSSCLKL